VNRENRRPIVIAVVCAVVALALLALTVGFGGHNNAAGQDWQHSIAGVVAGGRLTASDLSATGGPCSATGSTLEVTGTCTFTVKDFGGAFNLGAPTKRARLRPAQPVNVSVLVEGTRITQNVSAGDSVNLTFGTSGGELTVACPPLGTCVLELVDAGG
jgi:hypothetical protein